MQGLNVIDPTIKIIDKMMNLIEKGRMSRHGTAVCFKKGDSFVYISMELDKISVDGVILDLTLQEYIQVLTFIAECRGTIVFTIEELV